jgi:hypothetical protein
MLLKKPNKQCIQSLALLVYAVQHFTIGFMPHPLPGESVRVTVMVSCPAAISARSTLQLRAASRHLVGLDGESVAVRVRAQPVGLAQLGRAEELLVHVNLQRRN